MGVATYFDRRLQMLVLSMSSVECQKTARWVQWSLNRSLMSLKERTSNEEEKRWTLLLRQGVGGLFD